jgi:spore coat polysaccharide biosynthesis protein SpsF (cytidylyltransferase family)
MAKKVGENLRTIAIIQARLGSTRLPGKVLYDLAGLPMISFMVRRVEQVSVLDELVLATGDGQQNDPLVEIAQKIGLAVYRGSEEDVLSRFLGAAEAFSANIIVRLTGDCPLVDGRVISQVLRYREDYDLDYCTNVKPPSWPDGLDVSVFTIDTLRLAATNATLPSEREHVVPWMWKMSTLEGGDLLKAGNVAAPGDYSEVRCTVDDARDYLMLRALSEKMGPGRLLNAGWREITDCLKENPDIAAINAGSIRDAGLAKSRITDDLVSEK